MNGLLFLKFNRVQAHLVSTILICRPIKSRCIVIMIKADLFGKMNRLKVYTNIRKKKRWLVENVMNVTYMHISVTILR